MTVAPTRTPYGGVKGIVSNMTDAFFSVADKLTPWAKARQDSEVQPQDYKDPPAAQSESEDVLVDLVVNKRYKRAADAKYTKNREWIENIAFREGNPWSEWRSMTNQLEVLTDPDDPYRKFPFDNLIRQNCTDVLNHATAGDPDVGFQPARMQSPVDSGATAEATDIWAHVNMTGGWHDLKVDAASSAQDQGVAFVKHYFDPKAEALTWDMGPDGQMRTYKKRIGEIKRCVVMATELYPDPDGRTMEDWNWVIHVKRRPLEWIVEQFGKPGMGVKAESGDSYSGYIDMRLDSITGESLRPAESARNSAYVYEMWEKPSPAYEKGRYIVVAGDRLMNPGKTDWPYEKTDCFPFTPLPFQSRTSGVWPLTMVSDLKPLQRMYNTVLARTYDQINAEKITILVPDDCEISTDSFHLKANLQKVVYNAMGKKPEYIVPPAPDYSGRIAWLQHTEQRMARQCGTIGLSDAIAGQLESATAIELWLNQNATMFKQFIDGIESMAEGSARWVFALAKQFYNEPRLMFISADPDKEAQISAHDFRNMSAGGEVHINVVRGSGVGQTATVRNQIIMSMVQAGAFEPAKLPSTIIALKMMLDAKDDPALREMYDLAKQQMQMLAQQQQQPLLIAQQAEEGKAAQQLAEQKHEIDMQTLKNQGQVSNTQQGGIIKAQLIKQENEYEIEQQAREAAMPPDGPKISLSLAGKADVTAIQSAERALGLEPGADAETAQANNPTPALDPNKVLATSASVQTSRESTAAQRDMHSETTKTQQQIAEQAAKAKETSSGNRTK